MLAWTVRRRMAQNGTVTETWMKPRTVPLMTAARLFGLASSSTLAKFTKQGFITDGVPVLRVSGRYVVPVSAIERALGVELEPSDLERPDSEPVAS